MYRKALRSLSFNPRFAAAIVACLFLGAASAAAQSLLVDGGTTTTLNFSVTVGNIPDAQTVRLTTSNSQSISFQIGTPQPTASWLIPPQVSSPNTPADITIRLQSQFLAAGTYRTTLPILPIAPGYQQASIVINLSVGTGGGTIGTLVPSTTFLTFSSNFGFNPDAQTVTISSATPTNFTLNTQVNAPFGSNWLNVSASSFTVGPGAPVTLTVMPIPGSITTGSYTGTITLTPTSGAATTISVTLNYGTTGTFGTLTVSPNPLVLSALPGSSTAGTLTVSSVLGSSVQFFAASATSWLQVATSFGTTPQTILVTASASSLSTGTYFGSVTFTPAGGGQSTVVQVQFNVGTGGTGLLGLFPQTLAFSTPVGGSFQQGTVSIQNSIGSFSATTSVTNPVGGAWLSVSPTFGAASPATLTVTANPSGLGVGTYTGLITVVSQTGLTDFVSVTLNVGTTGAFGLTASPAALAFSATAGSGQTPSQTISVASTFNTTVQFTAIPQVSWLTVSQSNGFTPASITVQANSSSLTAGTYQGSVLISGGGTSVTVPVLVAIGNSNSTLNVSPSTLTLGATSGGSVVSGSVSVNSNSGASTAFSTQVVIGASWLTISSTNTVTPATLTMTANPFALGTGVYSGFVMVQPADGSTPQVVAVTLNVGIIGGTGNSIFNVTPGSLTFSTPQGGAAPAAQFLTISSLINQYVTFTTAATTQSGGNWLAAEPASGFASLTAPIGVSVNPTGLSSGTYQGTVSVTAQGLIASIPITLNVTGPAITATPSSLSFTAASGGTAPPTQTISLSTAGAPSSFTASTSTTTGANWLSVSPTSGSTPATLTVSVNPGSLAIGSYSGQVRVAQAGSTNPQVVNVSLTVTEPFTVSVSASQVSLSARAGDSAAATRTVNVTASSAGRAFTVAASAASGGNWLSATPSSGNTPADITISANAASLAVGTYNGTVTVTAAGATNSPQTISVALTVNPRGPVVSSIVHGAALVPGFFASGTIFTIFGDNLGPQTAATLQVGPNNTVTTTLGGVRVLVDGIPAPMIYAQARQLNAVIPYGVAGRAAAEVVVEFQSERSAAQQIPLSEAAPGIFTLDGSGRGQAAVLNQDNTVNSASNAAAKDSVISVFLTGTGQTTPPGTDGLIPSAILPAPLLPVTARIGDQDMEVAYAGAAQGLISGAIQVNIRIAPTAASGVQPIIVRIGRFSSQITATVAIR